MKYTNRIDPTRAEAGDAVIRWADAIGRRISQCPLHTVMARLDGGSEELADVRLQVAIRTEDGHELVELRGGTATGDGIVQVLRHADEPLTFDGVALRDLIHDETVIVYAYKQWRTGRIVSVDGTKIVAEYHRDRHGTLDTRTFDRASVQTVRPRAEARYGRSAANPVAGAAYVRSGRSGYGLSAAPAPAMAAAGRTDAELAEADAAAFPTSWDELPAVAEEIRGGAKPETIEVKARELRAGDVAVAGSFGIRSPKPIRILRDAEAMDYNVGGQEHVEIAFRVGPTGPATGGAVCDDSVINLVSRGPEPAAPAEEIPVHGRTMADEVEAAKDLEAGPGPRVPDEYGVALGDVVEGWDVTMGGHVRGVVIEVIPRPWGKTGNRYRIDTGRTYATGGPIQPVVEDHPQVIRQAGAPAEGLAPAEPERVHGVLVLTAEERGALEHADADELARILRAGRAARMERVERAAMYAGHGAHDMTVDEVVPGREVAAVAAAFHGTGGAVSLRVPGWRVGDLVVIHSRPGVWRLQGIDAIAGQACVRPTTEPMGQVAAPAVWVALAELGHAPAVPVPARLLRGGDLLAETRGVVARVVAASSVRPERRNGVVSLMTEDHDLERGHVIWTPRTFRADQEVRIYLAADEWSVLGGPPVPGDDRPVMVARRGGDVWAWFARAAGTEWSTREVDVSGYGDPEVARAEYANWRVDPRAETPRRGDAVRLFGAEPDRHRVYVVAELVASGRDESGMDGAWWDARANHVTNLITGALGAAEEIRLRAGMFSYLTRLDA